MCLVHKQQRIQSSSVLSFIIHCDLVVVATIPVLYYRGKNSPVTGLGWPRGFQEVMVPRFLDNGTGWWQGCQPYAPAAFTPRKYSRHSFLLEAESTPGL
jgi:hypothetical protein